MARRARPTWRGGVAAGIAVALAGAAFAAEPPSSALEPLRLGLEQSLARGLDWLARRQRPDGSFQDTSWGDNHTAVISLAGKAFLACGITPDDPLHGAALNRCVDFILATQRADGLFWREGAHTNGSYAFMYSHALSTVFLAEASGTTDADRQGRIDAALAKALALILRAQNPAGGWRYAPEPPPKADISVSAWCLMALRAARVNGARVPVESIDRAMEYVRSHARDDGQFGYLGRHDPSPTATAVGISSLCLGGMHDHPVLPKAGRVLLAQFGPAGDLGMMSMGAAMPGMPEYRRYCGALAMHSLGGEFWETYAGRTYPAIMAGQSREGNWGSPYTTAVNLLVLSFCLQQSPVYQR